MSDFNTIDVSVDGGVATVCLNRPVSMLKVVSTVVW